MRQRLRDTLYYSLCMLYIAIFVLYPWINKVFNSTNYWW